MIRVIYISLLVLLVCFGIVCAIFFKKDEVVVDSTNYPNVLRIFVHRPNEEYSFLIRDGNEIKTIHFKAFHNVHIFDDVSPNEPMWAQITNQCEPLTSTSGPNANFHIHSVKELEGGGWQTNDKFRTKGTTVPIE